MTCPHQWFFLKGNGFSSSCWQKRSRFYPIGNDTQVDHEIDLRWCTVKTPCFMVVWFDISTRILMVPWITASFNVFKTSTHAPTTISLLRWMLTETPLTFGRRSASWWNRMHISLTWTAKARTSSLWSGLMLLFSPLLTRWSHYWRLSRRELERPLD